MGFWKDLFSGKTAKKQANKQKKKKQGQSTAKASPSKSRSTGTSNHRGGSNAKSNQNSTRNAPVRGGSNNAPSRSRNVGSQARSGSVGAASKGSVSTQRRSGAVKPAQKKTGTQRFNGTGSRSGAINTAKGNERRAGAQRARDNNFGIRKINDVTGGTAKYFAQKTARDVAEATTWASKQAAKKQGFGNRGKSGQQHAPTRNDRLNETQKRQADRYASQTAKNRAKTREMVESDYQSASGVQGGRKAVKSLKAAEQKTLNEAASGFSDKKRKIFGQEVSNQDIVKGGIKLSKEMADYLVPYGATTKTSMKVAEGIIKGGKAAKAGKILTETGEKGAKALSADGKKLVREYAEKVAKGGNKQEAFTELSKKISKSDLKQNIKKELLANAMQDASIGTAIDAVKGKQEGLEGKEFRNYMATNAAMNLAIGAPVAAMAGRTGKAGKRALTAQTKTEINSSFSQINKMTRSEGSELLRLQEKQKAVGLSTSEGSRLTELQEKTLSNRGGIAQMDSSGKIVANNNKVVKDVLSPEEIKRFTTLQAKQANGTLKRNDIDSFVKLSQKVEGAYTAVQENAVKAIEYASKPSLARHLDLDNMDSAVNFARNAGDTKLEKQAVEARINVAKTQFKTDRTTAKFIASAEERSEGSVVIRPIDDEYEQIVRQMNPAFSNPNSRIPDGFTFTMNGKRIVMVNPNGTRKTAVTLAHELTHGVLKADNSFLESLRKFTGDEKWNKSLDEHRVMYENIKGANINEETGCDVMGDLIGKDKQVFAYLAGDNPSAFTKMRNYVKKFMGDPDYAKDSTLKDIYQQFEDGYKAMQNPSADDAIQNAMMKDVEFALNDEYAPVFYSKMYQVIDQRLGKGKRFGTQDFEKFFKKKGVKDEEVEWSGIKTFLNNRKSVTKEELLDYIQANALELNVKKRSRGGRTTGEELDYFVEHGRFSDKDITETKWGEGDSPYTTVLPGGTNYREYEYILPNGEGYSNDAMSVHWGDKDVVVHSRINDFTAGKADTIREVDTSYDDIAPEYDELSGEFSYWLNSIQSYGVASFNTQVGKARFYVSVTEGGADIRLTNGETGEILNEDYVSYDASAFDPIDDEDVVNGIVDEFDSTVMRMISDDEEAVLGVPHREAESTGEKVLFVEEIQSDWHNAASVKVDGRRITEYRDPKAKQEMIDAGKRVMEAEDRFNDIYAKYGDLYERRREYVSQSSSEMEDAVNELDNALYNAEKELERAETDFFFNDEIHKTLRDKEARDSAVNELKDKRKAVDDLRSKLEASRDELKKLKEKLETEFPEAKEFAKISKQYKEAEAELNKFVQDELEAEYNYSSKAPNAPYKGKAYTEYAMKRAFREAAENGQDYVAWTTADIQSARWSDEYAEGYRIEYDQDIPSFVNKYVKQFDSNAKVEKITLAENGETVWAIKLPEAMKQSVLYEGQPSFAMPREEIKGGLLNFTKKGKSFDPKNPRDVVDENGTVSREADEAYMKAVEDGDVETQRKMIEEVANVRFKDSKLRDENGNLIPVYHSTITGRFNVFDRSKASPQGDSGAGFYFSSSKSDSNGNYIDVNGPDNVYRIERRAEEILDIADAEGEYNGRVVEDWDDAYEIAEDELFVGSEEYVTYLNIRNPLYVGRHGDSRETDMLDSLLDDYEPSVKREDYDEEYEYEDALWYERMEYAEDKIDDIAEDVADIASAEDWHETVRAIKESIGECMEEGRMTYDDLKESLARRDVHYDNENGEDTYPEIARAIAEKLGYDGIIDSRVSQKFSFMGLKEGDFHAIAFKPEQIKEIKLVTKDDAGEVIPLSQRFDAYNDDIRYAAPKDGDFNGVKTFDPRQPRKKGSAANPVEFQRANNFDARQPRTNEGAENPVEFREGANDFDVTQPRTNERGENPVDFNEANTFNPRQARNVEAEPPESPARFTKPGEEREASLEGIRDKRFKKGAPPEKSIDDTVSEYAEAQKELSDFYRKYKGKDATKSQKFKDIQSRIDDTFKRMDGADRNELLEAISKAEDNGTLKQSVAGSLRSRVLRNDTEPAAVTAKQSKGKKANPKAEPKTKKEVAPGEVKEVKGEVKEVKGEVKDDIKSIEGMTQSQLDAEAAATYKHLENAINKYGEDAPRVKQLRDHLDEVNAAIGTSKKGAKEPEGGFAALGEEELPKGLRQGELAEDRKKPFVFKDKKTKEVTYEDFNRAVEDGKLAGISETKDQRTVVEKVAEEAGKAREAYDKAIELFVDDLHAYEALGRSIKDKAARERFLAQVNQLRVSKRMGRAYTEDVIDPLYRKYGLAGKTNAEKRNTFETYVFLKHNADRIKKGTDVYGGFVDESALLGARQDKERYEVAINNLKEEIAQREKLKLPPKPELDKGIKNYESKIAKTDKRIEKLINEGVERNNAVVKDIEKRFPEVKEFQKSIVEFADSLNKMDLEAGIIGKTGEKGYDTLKEMYPNYVPTYRNKARKVKDAEGKETEELGFEELLELNTFEEIDISKGMRRAKGGDDDLVPLYNQLVAKANMVAKRTEQNRMAQMIADVTGDVEPHEIPNNLSLKDALEAVPKTYEQNGQHKLIYFREGKSYTVDISPSMAREMKRWSGEEKLSILGYRLGSDPLTKTVSPLARTFKSAITDWNVIFGAKNFVRDQQTAWLYTKDLKGYVAAYPKVCAAFMPEKVARLFPKRVRDYCARYRRIYRAYMENGGKYSPLVRSDGVKALENWRKGNPLKWASDFNAILETFPRMQEFTASVDSDVRKLVDGGMSRDDAYSKVLGDHDMMSKAMYRSKDVTLNFDRGGTVGRWLNSSMVPFFNPAIQGLSKVVRFLVMDNKSATDWVKMMGFLSIGVAAPGALWEMRFGEDEDYKALTNYYKDNYYCLPIGDGKFVKIPKARELGALQNPIDHMIRHTQFGQPGDWKEMFRLGYEQIGPVSPVEDNFIAPLIRAKSNKNWFGGQIENKYDEQLKEQGKSDEVYDENTSLLAIKIGKQKFFKDHKITPKKIDNMMDSYLGVFYDMGIGQFNQANDNAGSKQDKVLQTGSRILNANFVVDSYISHKYSGAFYDKQTEIYDKIDKSEKGTQAYRDATGAKRRFNSNYAYDNMTFQQAISDVKSDTKLSAEKKSERIRELKKLQRDLQADSFNGKESTKVDVYDKLLKYYTLDKVINEYTYTSVNEQGKKTNALRKAWNTYKDTDEYKNNKKEATATFRDIFDTTRKFNKSVGESTTNISWDDTAFIVASKEHQGKNMDAVKKAFDVWDSAMKRANTYFDQYGGTLKTYTATHRKVVQSSINLGYEYTNKMDDAEKAVALAQGTTIDRGYYAEKIDRKTNAARCVVDGHGWTDQRLSTWAASHDIDCEKCDNWSKYRNGECSPDYVRKCIEKDSKAKSREEMSGLFALYFPNEPNPFGEIGDYSLDGDVGVESGGKGGWGHRRRRRGRRGGRRGGRGGGGSGSGGTMPQTASGAIKGKVTNPFGKVSDYRITSNVDDAYRKKAKKLREASRKRPS